MDRTPEGERDILARISDVLGGLVAVLVDVPAVLVGVVESNLAVKPFCLKEQHVLKLTTQFCC